MPIFSKLQGYWQRIPEDKRAKIVYEIRSIAQTFLAAFLVQIALDLQASNFVIPLSVMPLTSIIIAGVRSGVKALVQLFVAWVSNKYQK